MEKIKMMKKLVIILLCLPMMFSSCKKEENEPNNNLNNTTNNTDSITVLPPSQTFPFSFSYGLDQSYDVTRAEFEINCYEQTNLPEDVSYAYVSTDYVSPLFPNDTIFGNGLIRFYDGPASPVYNGIGMQGKFFTTTWPMNSSDLPTHSLNRHEEFMKNYIKSYSYTPGILTLDLFNYTCGVNTETGQSESFEWTVEMAVTEYSDGKIKLTIDQGPFTSSEGITWNSFLELTLEKNF
jgi:hypothetical protein